MNTTPRTAALLLSRPDREDGTMRALDVAPRRMQPVLPPVIPVDRTRRSSRARSSSAEGSPRAVRPRPARPLDSPPATTGAWMNVAQAAAFLGISEVTLRRTIERNATRGEDGSIVAKVDGVTARKLGRVWRLWLAPGWRSPMGER